MLQPDSVEKENLDPEGLLTSTNERHKKEIRMDKTIKFHFPDGSPIPERRFNAHSIMTSHKEIEKERNKEDADDNPVLLEIGSPVVKLEDISATEDTISGLLSNFSQTKCKESSSGFCPICQRHLQNLMQHLLRVHKTLRMTYDQRCFFKYMTPPPTENEFVRRCQQHFQKGYFARKFPMTIRDIYRQLTKLIAEDTATKFTKNVANWVECGKKQRAQQLIRQLQVWISLNRDASAAIPLLPEIEPAPELTALEQKILSMEDVIREILSNEINEVNIPVSSYVRQSAALRKLRQSVKWPIRSEPVFRMKNVLMDPQVCFRIQKAMISFAKRLLIPERHVIWHQRMPAGIYTLLAHLMDAEDRDVFLRLPPYRRLIMIKSWLRPVRRAIQLAIKQNKVNLKTLDPPPESFPKELSLDLVRQILDCTEED